MRDHYPDPDLCDHCNDKPAQLGCDQTGLDFCSYVCRDAEREKRADDYEAERIAAITSGNQN